MAEKLLQVEAVKLSPHKPFKWASGWNSPIYCDNRVALSYPDIRAYIAKSLIDTIKREFPDVDVIAGVATAGIPQASIIADRMGKSLIYVRAKPKDHGMTNLIEGRITPGQKVVVIEDLISTGGSSLKAVEALKEQGVNVLGMVAIFTYDFPVAAEAFKKAGVKLVTLSNYNALLEIAFTKKILDQKQLEVLSKWRENPSEWNAE
ncbi:MAG: orotate phosphoribosyltransferase [Cytophagaceae bacterium]|nr:orotate phosphoribosyltransferase [Cytophagaceae bacterium]